MKELEININYFGVLRHIAGRERERITVIDGATGRVVLNRLVEKYGLKMGNVLLVNREINPELRIIYNQQILEDFPTRKLHHEDEITFLISLSGG